MTATQPLSEAEDGTLWTASDVEFFRLLNEQLEVALGGGQQLISAAAAVISSSLLDFASQQHRRLGGEAIATASTAPAGLSALSSPTHFRRPSIIAGGLLEKTAEDRVAVAAAKAVDYNVLLAGVNDGTRCHNLASEIEVLLSDALGPEGAIHGYSGEPDTDGGTKREASKSFLHSALEAFKRNANHSATAAAAAVTSDPSVVSLFGKLFVVDKVGGGPWLEGEVSETLVATIADYLGDVEQYVTRDLRPMVAEAVLSRVVKITMEVCMRQLQCIRPGTVEAWMLTRQPCANASQVIFNTRPLSRGFSVSQKYVTWQQLMTQRLSSLRMVCLFARHPSWVLSLQSACWQRARIFHAQRRRRCLRSVVSCLALPEHPQTRCWDNIMP